MNNNLTEIIVVMDRSGSMSAIAKDMQSGFEAFVADQAKEPGDCRVTLVQFDGGAIWNSTKPDVHIDTVFENVPIKDVPKYVLIPRGNTPLLDAVGSTIDRVGERLKNTPEAGRPGRVLFMIITDGEENASHTYTRERVKEMVAHQKDVYKWEFTYLGANVDEFQEGEGLAVAGGASLGYSANSGGVQNMFVAASKNAKMYRSTGKSIEYDDEDRITSKVNETN